MNKKTERNAILTLAALILTLGYQTYRLLDTNEKLILTEADVELLHMQLDDKDSLIAMGCEKMLEEDMKN